MTSQKSDGSPKKTRTDIQTSPEIAVINNQLTVGGEGFKIFDNRVYMPYDKISSCLTDDLPKGLKIAFTEHFNSDAGKCEDLDLQFDKGVIVTFSITIDRKKQQHGMPGGTWGHLVAAAAETDPGCIQLVFFAVQNLSLHMVMRFEGGTVAEVIEKVLARLANTAERAKAAGRVLVAETDRLNTNQSA